MSAKHPDVDLTRVHAHLFLSERSVQGRDLWGAIKYNNRRSLWTTDNRGKETVSLSKINICNQALCHTDGLFFFLPKEWSDIPRERTERRETKRWERTKQGVD